MYIAVKTGDVRPREMLCSDEMCCSMKTGRRIFRHGIVKLKLLDIKAAGDSARNMDVFCGRRFQEFILKQG
jgi:hypothetical protein